jgi:hypothetical protein
MGLDLSVIFDGVCETTNFRYCRLADVIEDHGCAGMQIGSTGAIIYDIIFLILSCIVTLFFIGFLQYLANADMEYKDQRETRGLLFWRLHLLFFGASAFFHGMAVSVTSRDDSSQHFMLVLQGATSTAGNALLVIIALVDAQIVPLSRIPPTNPKAATWRLGWHGAGIGVSVVLGLAWVIILAAPSRAAIVFFGLALPIGAALFHVAVMVPVCLVRHLPMLLFYCGMMAVTNIGSLFVDLYLNGPLCMSTDGILTGASLSVLLFAFYRVFAHLFFLNLKRGEVKDGLGVDAARANAANKRDEFKPLPIELSDYTYDYSAAESPATDEDENPGRGY